MKTNNWFIPYAAGIFFLLTCLLVWLTPTPQQSNNLKQPSRFKVSAATTNENTSTGYQVRKISLEISLFTNLY
uniref:hypothetical protein n=1 Tax=Pedobacter schmidteae TaxID=2201271 RepID=UPI000EB386A5|nr:hypothetical protein [Pedobacter schmidteae]